MTDKQTRFVQEYLKDCNATQAAIRAGYSKRNADRIGPELLGKTCVGTAIQLALAEKAKRCEIDADWVVKRLKEVVERCMQNVPVLDSEGKETGEYRFDSRGANTGLQLIGKRLGMFRDRVELTGKDGGPLKAESEAISEEECAHRVHQLLSKYEPQLRAAQAAQELSNDAR